MDPATANGSRRPSRASLRHNTFIDPQTGARLRKSFTLHNVDGGDDDHVDDESSPLLPSGIESFRRRRLTLSTIWLGITNYGRKSKHFVVSDLGRGMFKCALAYLLGSMATFVPVLSTLLGRNDSKHLVATITVYFHPARSLGSMLDALILAATAFLYTAFVSVISMSVTVFFADTVHLIELGHAIVLVLFIGGGLGLIGWWKLRKGDPLVNIACSLASLALITVLTKETAIQEGDYSFSKIAQILKMIVAGVIATVLVSVLVFPISARRRLKRNLMDVTDSLADMLALITSSFISGDEAELEDPMLVRVTERHQKNIASIKQNLKESRYEHYFLGTERQSLIESKLTHCIQRITQSVGGLRSAAAMQFVVINKPHPMTGIRQPSIGGGYSSYGSQSAQRSLQATRPTTRTNNSLFETFKTAPSQAEITQFFDSSNNDLKQSSDSSESQPFELFIDHLGPSMRSLAYTLKEILDDQLFNQEENYAITVNPKFKISLDRALDLYRHNREEALKKLYEKKDFGVRRLSAIELDWEEAAACCGHFSFSLLEVAEEVKSYLVMLDQMQLEAEETPLGRTWSWLKFWVHDENRGLLKDVDPEVAAIMSRVDDLDLHFRIAEPHTSSKESHYNPDISQMKVKQKFFRRLYDIFSIFRREDVKYAIKVGFGAVIYALVSFIPATRPIYSHWRGEWGLLSYMLTCSMTIGASNTTGYSRTLGTCLGAIIAVAAWLITDGNPIALATVGFCMAYWTAYIIIGQGKGPMGRFIMLTYNLSALYAYSLSVLDDEGNGDETDKSKNPLIWDIAGHRVVAVLSGAIWALIITRAVWPISARQKIKDGLSLLWLRMGLIWKRDPLSILTEGAPTSQYMDLREEFELQRYLTKLQALIEVSKGEFELRGPFPHEVYTRILRSTGHMLDAFHAMNVVIIKDLRVTKGEEALLRTTTDERAQLCGRISHLFSVLASSMKLEYPLAGDALPNIEHTRDRLLARIYTGRKTKIDDTSIEDEDFGLLYTYALVTGQLDVEIRNVLKEVEALFGTLDEEVLRLQ